MLMFMAMQRFLVKHKLYAPLVFLIMLRSMEKQMLEARFMAMRMYLAMLALICMLKFMAMPKFVVNASICDNIIINGNETILDQIA